MTNQNQLNLAADEYIENLNMMRGQAQILQKCIDLLTCTYRNKNTIFLAGNGGSAADSQHIAAELVGRFKHNRRPISAISLTTDTSCLTAISNDFNYECVFERQIQAHVKNGDLLWILSVSGQSPNIVRAIDAAKSCGAKIILFTGKKCSNETLSQTDVSLVIDSSSSDIVQGCHQFCYHFLCECIESQIMEESS